MDDILLLNLPITTSGYKTMSEFASRAFPLGLASLSGVLKKNGLPFTVIDADALDMSIDEMVSKISDRKPRIIGISTYSPYAGLIKRAVKAIKEELKNSIVVLGGHHAFALRGELLNETMGDIVAIGEGENIFADVCDAVLNDKNLEAIKGIYFKKGQKTVYTEDREFIEDLDALPIPAYEKFPMEAYRGHFYRGWVSGRRKPFSSVITSRGCPFNCGFCSNVMWGKKVRFQSPERVIREIDYLVSNYGIKQFSFFDDTFTLDMKRAERICDFLIERGYDLDIYCSTRVDVLNEGLIKKMAASGFKWIGIGIESGNDRILKKISKNQSVKKCSEILRMIADNRIATYGNIILGYPEEDRSTLNDSLRFIVNNPVHLPQFNIFVPYPGTPIYDELVAKGIRMPKDTNQMSNVISYNKDISTRYLHLFLWYSYFRSLVSMKYLNLIRKTFKLSIVFSDVIKLGWAMLRLNREESTGGKPA